MPINLRRLGTNQRPNTSKLKKIRVQHTNKFACGYAHKKEHMNNKKNRHYINPTIENTQKTKNKKLPLYYFNSLLLSFFLFFFFHQSNILIFFFLFLCFSNFCIFFKINIINKLYQYHIFLLGRDD